MFTLQIIYSKLTDLLPAEVVAEDDPSLERPSDDDVRETTEKTRRALERLTHTKIAAAMPVRCAERAVSIILHSYIAFCSMK
jgi:SNW domain-containing protein 1